MATAAVSPSYAGTSASSNSGIWSWLTTVDHKRIGALYLYTSLAWFAVGGLEAFIMRIIDLQLSLPAILLALVLVALLGQGLPQLVAALVAAQYAYFARTAHGAASAERRKDYIEAALSTPLPARRAGTRGSTRRSSDRRS